MHTKFKPDNLRDVVVGGSMVELKNGALIVRRDEGMDCIRLAGDRVQ
jgi:hypothetical protein